MASNAFQGAGPFAPAPSFTAGGPMADGVTVPTPSMTTALASTRTWLTVVGAILALGAGFLAIVTVVMTLMMRRAGVVTAVTVVPLLVYLAMTASSAVMALRVLDHGRAVGGAIDRPGLVTLESAARSAQRLWTAVGIMVIAWIVLTVLGGAVAGIVMASRMTRPPPAIESTTQPSR